MKKKKYILARGGLHARLSCDACRRLVVINILLLFLLQRLLPPAFALSSSGIPGLWVARGQSMLSKSGKLL